MPLSTMSAHSSGGVALEDDADGVDDGVDGLG
jgi:hypothetical protein